MAGTNLGTAYVTIMPSTKGITGSISQSLSGEATSAGKSAGGKLVKAITGVIAGAGITAAFKKAIDAGGELEQNLGGTEAVFGKFADNVQKTATEAYKNMGLSASDYMATANKMGSLFQGSGVEQERSLELTTKAMQRAADVASVMGLDTTSAMESIAGAAKGNFTMMDNLGVAMNATTLAAYALEKGVNFDWNTASNAEKAELAMQMFMDRTAQYEGNFARESEETFAGSLGAMKAASTNFISNLSLGKDISGPLQELQSTSKTFFMNNLLPMIGNVLKGIPTMIGDILTNAFNNLPSMVDGAISFIHGLTEGITSNSGEFFSGISELMSAAWTAITETDWIGLGGAIISLLWEGIQALAPMVWNGLKSIALKAWEAFKSIDWPAVGSQVVHFIGDAIGGLGRLIWDGLSSIGQTAKEKFQNVDWAEAGANAFHALVDAITNIGSILWDALTTIGQTAGEHFKGIDWPQVGRDVLQGIANGITAIGSFLYEALSTAATNAIEFFKNVDWEQAGKDAVTFIANGISNIASAIWDALTTIGKTAGTKLKELDWKQLGIDILNAIKSGIVSVGSFLWGAIKGIGEMAWNKLLEVNWIQSGIDIINGIIDGIKQFGAQIGETIVGFAKDAWTRVKNFFKIGSPSKLMRDTVGKWIPLGIAEGIKMEADAVTDAMKGVVDDASVSVNPAVNMYPDGTTPELAGSVALTFNVYGQQDPEEFASRALQQLKMEMRIA